MRSIQVNLNERVVVLQRALPKAALAPGRYWFWGSGSTELRYDTNELVFNAAQEEAEKEAAANVILRREEVAVTTLAGQHGTRDG